MNGSWADGNLEASCFKQANLVESTLTRVRLRKCSFWDANARQADFSFSDFSDNDFRFACLAEANLCDTTLADCDFTEADFRKAVMRHADISSANFSQAKSARVYRSGRQVVGICRKAPGSPKEKIQPLGVLGPLKPS